MSTKRTLQARTLETYSEGIRWLCSAVGDILLSLDSLVRFEGRVIAIPYKIVLRNDFNPMMRHFYPDGSSLFQDDNAPIHRTVGVTEWFDEYEKDEKHVLWP